MPSQIPLSSISAMLEREAHGFIQRNPGSKNLAEKASKHWLRGVPMHWMVDWGTPFPLFISTAQGVDLTDIDGHKYVDFCLGDTGAMFGHSPIPVAETLAKEGANGLTTMMPSPDAAIVGELLADRFGLPLWQVTATASDANRAVIKWLRAISGRKKILVFSGCYHGAVDEAYVQLDANGNPIADPALIGEVHDVTQFTKVVEFNDIEALRQALAARDVACVLTEPMLTNTGMVMAEEGFHKALREATHETGTYLIMDETHTMSSGPGGYTKAYGLEPDAIVMGKPIAGGIPAAVYGLSAEIGERIAEYLKTRIPGHSGIGTTLSGSRIQLALMRTVLETYFTKEAFAPLLDLAQRLERGIADVIIKYNLPWHVLRVGARVEFMCTPKHPRNGTEAARVIHQPVDIAIHHYLLNRGVVITPFHNMMLICPATKSAHVDQLINTLDACAAELLS